MKAIRLLFFLLLPIIALGQSTSSSYPYPEVLPTTGDTPLTTTRITTVVNPTSYADPRPTIWDDFVGGGYRSVKSTAERDSILSGRRKQGMLVWVADDNHTYQLATNLTSWVDLGVSGGNFATADLTLTTNRTHNGGGHTLTLTNISDISWHLSSNVFLRTGWDEHLMSQPGWFELNVSRQLSRPESGNTGSRLEGYYEPGQETFIRIRSGDYGSGFEAQFDTGDMHPNSYARMWAKNRMYFESPAVIAETAAVGQVLTMLDLDGLTDFADPQNFATTDLTLSANRLHNAANHHLIITNAADFKVYSTNGNLLSMHMDGDDNTLIAGLPFSSLYSYQDSDSGTMGIYGGPSAQTGTGASPSGVEVGYDDDTPSNNYAWIWSDVALYIGTPGARSNAVVTGSVLSARSADGIVEFGGDLVLDNIVQPVGKTISITSGTDQRAGNATLSGGSIVVTNTTVTANTLVMHSRKTISGTVGHVTYSVSPGTSFTLTSDSGTDAGVISYLLIEVP